MLASASVVTSQYASHALYGSFFILNNGCNNNDNNLISKVIQPKGEYIQFVRYTVIVHNFGASWI